MNDPDLVLPDVDSLVTVEPPPPPPAPPRRTRTPRRARARRPGFGLLILLVLVVPSINTAGVVAYWAGKASLPLLVAGCAATDLLILVGIRVVLSILPRRG